MQPQLWISTLALLLLAAGPPKGDDDDQGDDEGEGGNQSQLSPPASAPAPGAFGSVKLSKDDGEQEFKVMAFGLPTTSPPGPFEVWLASAVSGNTFFEVGTMSNCGKSGNWKLKLESDDGAPPALGVSDINDTKGRNVQVRDGTGVTIYLVGTIGGTSGKGCQPTPPRRGKLGLTRPKVAPAPSAHGAVKIHRMAKHQVFHVDTKNMGGDTMPPFFLQLETGVGTGVFKDVAMLEKMPGKADRFDLDLDKECEAPGDLDVPDVDDLEGRKVRVRDVDGHEVLQGACPKLVSEPGKLNFNHKSKLLIPNNPPSPKASGEVHVKFNNPQGESSFEIRVKHLEKGGSYSLFVEDGVGSGAFQNVGSIASNGKGVGGAKNGELQVNTKNGSPLPFGVVTVGDLAGRLVEIRDASGTIHLVGQVPP